MSLLTTYGESNKVVETDTDIVFSRGIAQGNWSYVSGTSTITIYRAWQYTRRATRQYKYVGMTRSAANTCAANLRTSYTRETWISVWNSEGSAAGTFTQSSGGSFRMTSVEVRHAEGQAWDVVVSVDETDTKMSVQALSPASLFTNEDSRTYDY